MIGFDSIMLKWTRYAICILLVFILTNCTKKINFENQRNTDSKKVYSQRDTTKIIDGFYPEIALDYMGAYEGRIVQDFGEPITKCNLSQLDIDEIPEGCTNRLLTAYTYSFDNGLISFHIDQQLKHVFHIEIRLNENNSDQVNILIPGLIDKKEANYTNIVLGKSTFKDLLKVANQQYMYLQEAESYEQGLVSGPFRPFSTRMSFDGGRFTQYHSYIFGVNGFYDEVNKKNYDRIKGIKPTCVLIM